MSHAQGHGHGQRHLVPPLPRRGAGKLTSAPPQFAQLAKDVMAMNGSEWQPNHSLPPQSHLAQVIFK